MTLLQPPAAAASKPSANGKKPSLAQAPPESAARPAAISTALTRLVCPAQMPCVTPSLTITMPLDLTCRTTSHANARSRHCAPVGLRRLTTRQCSCCARGSSSSANTPPRALRTRSSREFVRERRRKPHDPQILFLSQERQRVVVEGG